MAKIIVSASRRTDLPRFYYEWLQQVLAAQQVAIANPRFPEKTYNVDLRPENVHSLVLWSKDFSNVLKDPGRLGNYNLYFQYTINKYTKLLEPGVPDYQQSMTVLDGLLKSYRPDQFNIRFDPVLLSTQGEIIPTPRKPGRARLKAFENLCGDLVVMGMQNCRITTSYLAMYGHVRKRLNGIGLDITPLASDLQVQFFGKMAEIAARYGLQLFSCACPLLDSVPGIQPGRCVDGDLLEGLFGGKISKAKDNGQRSACRCHKSADIGDYRKKCEGGCLYCYATGR